MFGINHQTAPARKVIADITRKPGRIKKIHDWLVTTEKFFDVKRWHLLLIILTAITYVAIIAWFY